MADENSSDIHIGENKRIQWIEFDSSSNDHMDIDYIVAKHDDFWAYLQIFCVPDCCGLDAFRFYPEDIRNAVKQADKELIKGDLLALRSDLLESDRNIVKSSRLNNMIDKTVFIKLLDHILNNL